MESGSCRRTQGPGRIRSASKELVVESIDLQRVRPPTRSELVGSHLRGDRLYGEVVIVTSQLLIPRPEDREGEEVKRDFLL